MISAIKSLYKLWNKNYCQGQFLFNTGLKEEPYFRYFSYPDFLMPYSGLIQIRKYAEIHNLDDLQEQFAQISALTKKVREELYQMLVLEAKYFEGCSYMILRDFQVKKKVTLVVSDSVTVEDFASHFKKKAHIFLQGKDSFSKEGSQFSNEPIFSAIVPIFLAGF